MVACPQKIYQKSPKTERWSRKTRCAAKYSQEHPASLRHTLPVGVSRIEELMTDLDTLKTWKVEDMQDKEVSIKLFEQPYSIHKDTINIDSGLDFSPRYYQAARVL